MWSADKQIVANQRGDVRRQRTIAELLPARICEPPNINWKCDALRHRAQRCEYQVVSAAGSDVLQMTNSFHDLDEQTGARLTRPIVCNEFAVDRILCGLRVSRDLQCDCVIGIRTKIVADQFHRIRSKDRVSKFRAALLYSGSEQSGNRDALANSLCHLRQSLQLIRHCCL